MRRQLLDVAMEGYLESGLEGVTLRQIAVRSGLSHSIVYRYFDSKESLLAAMRTACLQEFQEAMSSMDQPGAPALKRIRAVLSGALSFGQRESAKYRLVFSLPQPDLSAYPALCEQRRDVFDSCVDLVLAAIDKGELKGDALTLTHGLWSTLHGMLALHTAGQLIHGQTLEDMAGPVLDLFLGAAPPL